MSYSSVVLADSPIRYYRLDETSGTSAADSGSQNHAGTYTGGFTLNQTGLLKGDTDAAVKLNGSTGYVSLPTTGLPTGAGTWSVECWVSLASLSGDPEIIFIGTNSTNQAINLWYSTGTGKWVVDLNGSSHATGGTVSTNTTYHLIATYDGTKLSLYANGALVDGPNTVTANVTLGLAQIGVFNTSSEFTNGTIDEVAIYNVALSSTQVSNHWNTGISNIMSGTDGNTGSDIGPGLQRLGVDNATGSDIGSMQVGGIEALSVSDTGTLIRWGVDAGTVSDVGGSQQYGADTGSVSDIILATDTTNLADSNSANDTSSTGLAQSGGGITTNSMSGEDDLTVSDLGGMQFWATESNVASDILAQTNNYASLDAGTVSDNLLNVENVQFNELNTGVDTSNYISNTALIESNSSFDNILTTINTSFIDNNSGSDILAASDIFASTEASTVSDALFTTNNSQGTEANSIVDSLLAIDTSSIIDASSGSDTGGIQRGGVENNTSSDSLAAADNIVLVDLNTGIDGILVTDAASFSDIDPANDTSSSGLTQSGGGVSTNNMNGEEDLIGSDTGGIRSWAMESSSGGDSLVQTNSYSSAEALSGLDSLSANANAQFNESNAGVDSSSSSSSFSGAEALIITDAALYIISPLLVDINAISDSLMTTDTFVSKDASSASDLGGMQKWLTEGLAGSDVGDLQQYGIDALSANDLLQTYGIANEIESNSIFDSGGLSSSLTNITFFIKMDATFTDTSFIASTSDTTFNAEIPIANFNASLSSEKNT